MAHSGDSEEKLEVVRVRLPEEVLRILDGLVERGLYASRSEAIREFAREYVISHGGRHA